MQDNGRSVNSIDKIDYRLELAEKIMSIQDKQIAKQEEQISYLHSVVHSMRLSMRVKSIFDRIFPQKVSLFLRNSQKHESNNKGRDRKNNPYYFYKKPQEDIEIYKDIYNFNIIPLISIFLTLEKPHFLQLKKTIDSIEKQWYPCWEICIVLPNTQDREVVDYLNNIKNERIKVKYIYKATTYKKLLNAALSISKGKYFALLKQGNLLTEDALYEIVKTINEKSSDFVYCDEDSIDLEENYIEPIFKPDFSCDLLLSYNYIGDFFVVNSGILEGENSFDIILNATEKANSIAHIPKVLYHRRKQTEASNIRDEDLKAVQKYFERHNLGATVKKGNTPLVFNIKYRLPNPSPLVSIIIPTRDNADYLDVCIESILHISSYRNIEIIILNNNSQKEETYIRFSEYQSNYSFIKVLDANYEFNWAKLNNQGILKAKGDVYIFLNNDVKVITPDWIERLAAQALLPGVGTVGPLLLFEDDTIQHAGLVIGLRGWADHIYRGSPRAHTPTPFISPLVSRNVLALTGACLVVSKKVIGDIGMFDEEYLVVHSDIELSIRAYEKGYRNVYDANTELYHYESKTRNNHVPECDLERSKDIYQHFWDHGDPFYNQNLSLAEYHPTPA